MKQRKLVVISAGLSQPSSTRLLADQLSASAVRAAGLLGVTLDVQVVELRDLAHEITDNMLTGFAPASLKQAQEAVTAADALITVSPVFSASYSGLFKSFFDVLDKDALIDKPVLLAATAGTARHSLVLEHALRPLFSYLRAAIIPTSVFAASDDWGANSVEGPLRGRIERAAAELAREVERREPAVVTDPFALTANFEDMLKNL
ncbi:FMN reductase [Actinoplanes couchii]|uniref:FMN reductase n=1 Tax=Actinoplanes couchii TaxID=403638 RepID=A0ABQ3XG89_9ACTN|nr:FMN reductase [Actinoplanes couchii]MDR6320988.1 FMN reductase [Actinoplanes couchii]GID57499.1 FMN reductase [Actinoplanes couchii]